jgi:dynein heavy chain 1, cytosolic
MSQFNTPDLNLKSIVFDETSASTPLAFCSVPGYDAASLVESFASVQSQKLAFVAMGSPEGFSLADAAIS